MSTTTSKYDGWFVALFIGASVLSLSPLLARAQEVAPEAPRIPASSDEGFPYEVEPLLGDEVYGDFVVGPGKLEVEVAPGETKVVQITVSNRTGMPKTFEVTAEDAIGSDDPNRTLILLGDDRGPYSMKDYVSVPLPRFILRHNERAKIPVTIRVPADAEPGGLYGSMLVGTVSQEAKSGDAEGTKPQSAIIARIGSLFFITIPGDVERGGGLKEFGTVPPRKVYQEGPITFGILFENTGSIHLRPYGELRITNMLGEEVGIVDLDPWFILPKSARLREVTWDRELLFGRYRATVAVNKGYEDTTEEMIFEFWVLPWKPIALAFIALFAVIFLIRLFFRTFEFKRRT